MYLDKILLGASPCFGEEERKTIWEGEKFRELMGTAEVLELAISNEWIWRGLSDDHREWLPDGWLRHKYFN